MPDTELLSAVIDLLYWARVRLGDASLTVNRALSDDVDGRTSVNTTLWISGEKLRWETRRAGEIVSQGLRLGDEYWHRAFAGEVLHVDESSGSRLRIAEEVLIDPAPILAVYSLEEPVKELELLGRRAFDLSARRRARNPAPFGGVPHSSPIRLIVDAETGVVLRLTERLSNGALREQRVIDFQLDSLSPSDWLPPADW